MDIAEIRKRAKQLREMAEVEEPFETKEVYAPAEEEPKAGMPVIEQHAKEEENLETVAPKPETYPLEPTPPASPEPEAVFEGPKGTPHEEIKEKAAEGMVEAITFLLDREEYAIDIRLVKEVIKNRELTDVPRAPKDIMGVISLRGTVIPVMNLRGRLGMPVKEGFERIIIVRDGASFLGLMVDDVKQVIRIPKNNIEAPPSINTIDGEFIKGIGRHKGEMFILLEMEKILESM